MKINSYIERNGTRRKKIMEMTGYQTKKIVRKVTLVSSRSKYLYTITTLDNRCLKTRQVKKKNFVINRRSKRRHNA